jgi:ABC-type ATPase involved in cell division
MAITRIKLERFTAFRQLDFVPSPGINVIVGANGTGKTHLMKVAYAACDVSKTGAPVAQKLVRLFLPSGRSLGRLVRRQQGSSRCSVEVYRDGTKLRASFSNHATAPDSAKITGAATWSSDPVRSVYIPVKEMLANSPGFRSLYSQREIHFEEIYSDILDRAHLPVPRGAPGRERGRLLKALQKTIAGKVTVRDEEFFLRNKQGNLEFTLLSEGMRKLGLLWLLIRNGTLLQGSVLFWDEPETNLNPKLFGPLIDILVQLQRVGIQIFIATHDYAILKEVDLRRTQQDSIKFHSLYHDRDEVACRAADAYLDIHPNTIAEAFTDLYNREVRVSLGGPQ